MITDPHDALDTLADARDARDFQVGRNIRRLKRYGLYYRRLRTRQRIGVFIQRVIDAGMLDGGDLIGMLAAAWTAIRNRRRSAA